MKETKFKQAVIRLLPIFSGLFSGLKGKNMTLMSLACMYVGYLEHPAGLGGVVGCSSNAFFFSLLTPTN